MANINEADVLRQLGAKGIGKATDEVYIDFLTVIADEISESFRDYLRSNTRGSGTLAQSVTAKPQKNGFSIDADFYYDFIDEGVKGAPLPAGVKEIPKNQKGQGRFNGPSRFAFETIYSNKDMERSIAEYSGRPIGSNHGVVVNIKKRGIHPANITDNVITEEVLRKISEDLTELTGLAVQASFQKLSDKK